MQVNYFTKQSVKVQKFRFPFQEPTAVIEFTLFECNFESATNSRTTSHYGMSKPAFKHGPTTSAVFKPELRRCNGGQNGLSVPYTLVQRITNSIIFMRPTFPSRFDARTYEIKQTTHSSQASLVVKDSRSSVTKFRFHKIRLL